MFGGNMKNKNAFTLIELLAVIIILSMLAIIGSVAVTKIVKDSKEELSQTQKESIISAAEMWSADNLDKMPQSGECKYILLSDLKNYGLLGDVIDPKTNSEMEDIKVYIKPNENNPLSFDFTLTKNDTCTHIE